MDATLARARAEALFKSASDALPQKAWKSLEERKTETARYKTKRLRALRLEAAGLTRRRP
jgi:hypothetical protein